MLSVTPVGTTNDWLIGHNGQLPTDGQPPGAVQACKTREKIDHEDLSASNGARIRSKVGGSMTPKESLLISGPICLTLIGIAVVWHATLPSQKGAGPTTVAPATPQATPIGSIAPPDLPPATRLYGSALGVQVAKEAQKYLGVPYLFGGETKAGIDSGALVKVAFNACAVEIPRYLRNQVNTGNDISVDAMSQWEPGDRLYFALRHDRIDHAGLYIGDGVFIHATDVTPLKVTQENMASPYYRQHLVAVRRSVELLTNDQLNAALVATQPAPKQPAIFQPRGNHSVTVREITPVIVSGSEESTIKFVAEDTIGLTDGSIWQSLAPATSATWLPSESVIITNDDEMVNTDDSEKVDVIRK